MSLHDMNLHAPLLRVGERAPSSVTVAPKSGAVTEADDVPGRPLRGFELVMAQLGIADLIVAELEGPRLDVDRLRQAAAHLQARHPSLRAAVRREGERGRPWFRYGPPANDRLHVELVAPSSADTAVDDSRPFWQRVVEREVGHRFDIAAGYMFRVVWIPTDEGRDVVGDHGRTRGHLVLNAQHALVDGVSLMRLLHELLGAYADLSAAARRSDLAPTPSALEQLRVRGYEKVISQVAKAVTIRQQRGYAARSLLPIRRPLAADGQPDTHCRFATGRPDAFAAVRLRAKAEQVTIGGAYAAAIHFTTLAQIARTTGRLPRVRGRIKLPMSMDFSLRPAIDGGHVCQEAVGLFSGVAEVGIRVAPEITFWDLARRLMTSARTQQARRAPVLFHQAFDRVWHLDDDMRRYGIDHVASGGTAEAVSMSNVGAYPYPHLVGSQRIANVYGLSAALRGGPMQLFWLRAVDGHFCYNATSLSPACDRADADSWFAATTALMERCGDPDVATLRLDHYLAHGLPGTASRAGHRASTFNHN